MGISSSPIAVVRNFIAAIERKDIEIAIEMLDENISYENMPTSPVIGKANVRKVLGGFLSPATEVEWQIVSECEIGEMVYNERLDRFLVNGGWLELPIAGVFRVLNGRIVLWRDYFDMGTYVKQFAQLTKQP